MTLLTSLDIQTNGIKLGPFHINKYINPAEGKIANYYVDLCTPRLCPLSKKYILVKRSII